MYSPQSIPKILLICTHTTRLTNIAFILPMSEFIKKVFLWEWGVGRKRQGGRVQGAGGSKS
ncbi:hypothetical protein NSP_9230 [Nodularia spumigena CCY9414]|nr:hypothetical protein NSP_9230 [Nodularia spumigena CCY9414]